jgi:proteasome accessory factor C
MTDTAAAQLQRVLDLIPRLADGEEHPIADVARELGRSPRELLGDLNGISARFDTPGGFVEGVSIFVEDDKVCVSASQFLRPMRLTMPELCALELGLTLIRRERTPAEQGPIDRALERLRDAITNVPSNDRHEGTRYADLDTAGSAEHLSVLKAAVRARTRVWLRYRAGGASESTERVVSPHAVVFSEQMWYLVATGDDDGLRFFRLDRIEAVKQVDEPFERDDALLLRVHETGRAFASEGTVRMRVRYSPRIARWVAEREGRELDGDGGLTMEHPLADESWAVRHVLQYGPDAEVLEPAELRDMIATRLAGLVERGE